MSDQYVFTFVNPDLEGVENTRIVTITNGPGPVALTRLLHDILRSSTCREACLKFQREIQKLRDVLRYHHEE